MSLVNFVDLVPPRVSWIACFCGFVLSWINFFSYGSKLLSRLWRFSLVEKNFSCGLRFFPLDQNFFTWVGFFFSWVNFFCRGWKTSSVLFSCLNFFRRSKFCFRGITQVFSIDHDQTKLLGKLGVLVSKKLGMIGNHGK